MVTLLSLGFQNFNFLILMGMIDVKRWICRCEQFLEVGNILDNAKVKIASIHLSGRALLWHQSFMKSRNKTWPGWEEYKRAILKRFGAQPFDDPLAKLIKLKQPRFVEQY